MYIEALVKTCSNTSTENNRLRSQRTAETYHDVHDVITQPTLVGCLCSFLISNTNMLLICFGQQLKYVEQGSGTRSTFEVAKLDAVVGCRLLSRYARSLVL